MLAPLNAESASPVRVPEVVYPGDPKFDDRPTVPSHTDWSYADGIDNALEDIRLHWVDEPTSSELQKFRSLKRYALELNLITNAQKEYSRTRNKIDHTVVDAVYHYGLKAHDVYRSGLLQWLEDNRASEAYPVLQNLLNKHDQNGSTGLVHFHKRALVEPDDRSSATNLTSNAGSFLSHRSAQVIEEQRHEKKVSLSN